eukprot:3432610-Rhodomonas_salina.2
MEKSGYQVCAAYLPTRVLRMSGTDLRRTVVPGATVGAVHHAERRLPAPYELGRSKLGRRS